MTTTETIRDLQNDLNQALLAADSATLRDLVAPGARIVGPRGFLIGRDEWIGVHEGGDYQQVRLDVSDSEIVAADDAGVRVDVVDSECVYQGEQISGRFRVLQTWARRDGRWQLLGLQYTPVATG